MTLSNTLAKARRVSRGKSITQKANKLRDLEQQFHAIYAQLLEVMRAKEMVRAGMASDLADDRAAVEAHLKAIHRRNSGGRAAVCPSCKRPFPPWLAVRGPVRQRVVDVVAARPHGITASEIMDVVYAQDPNGGPANANVISVLVHNANRELKRHGYMIGATWKGRGARYKLMKLNGKQTTTTNI